METITYLQSEDENRRWDAKNHARERFQTVVEAAEWLGEAQNFWMSGLTHLNKDPTSTSIQSGFAKQAKAGLEMDARNTPSSRVGPWHRTAHNEWLHAGKDAPTNILLRVVEPRLKAMEEFVSELQGWLKSETKEMSQEKVDSWKALILPSGWTDEDKDAAFQELTKCFESRWPDLMRELVAELRIATTAPEEERFQKRREVKDGVRSLANQAARTVAIRDALQTLLLGRTQQRIDEDTAITTYNDIPKSTVRCVLQIDLMMSTIQALEVWPEVEAWTDVLESCDAAFDAEPQQSAVTEELLRSMKILPPRITPEEPVVLEVPPLSDDSDGSEHSGSEGSIRTVGSDDETTDSTER